MKAFLQIIATAAALVVVVWLATMMAARAHAGTVWWDWRNLGAGPNGYVIGSERTRRTYRKYRRRHTHTHVKKYTEERQADNWTCLQPVTVVGSQWADDAGALKSARKAWMEQVRWKHGEAFMDVDNAREVERRCNRSSIGEVLNQTLHRCQLRARPCRPPLEAADK